ncbi:uncharacterized protein TNCV_2607581 [Trichonephila clavipes]|uniref:Mos1 transposase HTH domain-containing protein n=1 Tax=Trichonephila clavipes TaxID=2585209 RepID=A0A8X6RUZ8_TRICX|nr:uncharacterized protein TNCV_2607581 [Trichonephila clavipes]
MAAVAEWYRYRIVACLVMSSSPVPLKTRRVEHRCTLNLSRAKTSSRWCGVVVRRGGCQLSYTRAFGDGPRPLEPWSVVSYRVFKMEVNKEKIRFFVQFFFDKGRNASQVAEIANCVYGAVIVTASYVQHWFRRFGSGIFDV